MCIRDSSERDGCALYILVLSVDNRMPADNAAIVLCRAVSSLTVMFLPLLKLMVSLIERIAGFEGLDQTDILSQKSRTEVTLLAVTELRS